jgi:hypothetical protein
MRVRQDIKSGLGSNLLIGAAVGLGLGLFFVVLGGTALGYAIVATVIVAAILWVIFGVIV